MENFKREYLTKELYSRFRDGEKIDYVDYYDGESNLYIAMGGRDMSYFIDIKDNEGESTCLWVARVCELNIHDARKMAKKVLQNAIDSITFNDLPSEAPRKEACSPRSRGSEKNEKMVLTEELYQSFRNGKVIDGADYYDGQSPLHISSGGNDQMAYFFHIMEPDYDVKYFYIDKVSEMSLNDARKEAYKMLSEGRDSIIFTDLPSEETQNTNECPCIRCTMKRSTTIFDILNKECVQKLTSRQFSDICISIRKILNKEE
jgi:hypothetical protein